MVFGFLQNGLGIEFNGGFEVLFRERLVPQAIKRRAHKKGSSNVWSENKSVPYRNLVSDEKGKATARE